MRDWKKAWVFVSALVSLAVAAAGCNSVSRPEERTYGARSTDPQQRAAVVQDRNHDTIDRGAGVMEDRDYLMGRNANPNTLVNHPAVQNKAVDIRNMQMMAKSVPGVENARITLHGGNAYITLDLIHNVTAGQARQIEQQVIAALRQKVPRYDFHITSNDSFHR